MSSWPSWTRCPQVAEFHKADCTLPPLTLVFCSTVVPQGWFLVFVPYPIIRCFIHSPLAFSVTCFLYVLSVTSIPVLLTSQSCISSRTANQFSGCAHISIFLCWFLEVMPHRRVEKTWFQAPFHTTSSCKLSLMAHLTSHGPNTLLRWGLWAAIVTITGPWGSKRTS